MDRLIEDILKDWKIRGMALKTVLHYMYCLKAFKGAS
jgi:hypothetical protein